MTFIVEFSTDRTRCIVTDDRGKTILAVVITGEVSEARQDRIAKLAGELMAECQDGVVALPPFKMGSTRAS
jgi:hypothetical protein